MITSMALWATGRSGNDQPLTKAARLALEADPTPRAIRFAVGQDGQPIEIHREEPLSQLLLPIEAPED